MHRHFESKTLHYLSRGTATVKRYVKQGQVHTCICKPPAQNDRTSMYESSNLTFEQILESGTLSFASRCLYWTELEVACSHIDRLYAEAANPDSEYFKRCHEVLFFMINQSINPEPSDSEDTSEIYAYLRAHPSVHIR